MEQRTKPSVRCSDQSLSGVKLPFGSLTLFRWTDVCYSSTTEVSVHSQGLCKFRTNNQPIPTNPSVKTDTFWVIFCKPVVPLSISSFNFRRIACALKIPSPCRADTAVAPLVLTYNFTGEIASSALVAFASMLRLSAYWSLATGHQWRNVSGNNTRISVLQTMYFPLVQITVQKHKRRKSERSLQKA